MSNDNGNRAAVKAWNKARGVYRVRMRPSTCSENAHYFGRRSAGSFERVVGVRWSVVVKSPGALFVRVCDVRPAFLAPNKRASVKRSVTSRQPARRVEMRSVRPSGESRRLWTGRFWWGSARAVKNERSLCVLLGAMTERRAAEVSARSPRRNHPPISFNDYQQITIRFLARFRNHPTPRGRAIWRATLSKEITNVDHVMPFTSSRNVWIKRFPCHPAGKMMALAFLIRFLHLFCAEMLNSF